MDWRLTPCSTSSSSLGGKIQITNNTDRINSLDDNLLSKIVCALSTKDAFALTLSCKAMLTRVFTLITSLDFDDSPISHSRFHFHQIGKRYPQYKNFVDTVLLLRASLCSTHDQDHLTKFRLQLGRTIRPPRNKEGCFPHMDPAHLNAWICYPLTRKVKELDLSIHVNVTDQPRGLKLPSEIFSCHTLEVLKLNVNLETPRRVDYYFFCLPNLKVLHLSSLVIVDDGFVTSLVSSCPSLEDLTVQYCTWKQGDFITITSRSLRRLVLNMMECKWYLRGDECDEGFTSKAVLIDTPSLQHLTYVDDLAWQYSITSMNAIVTAEIDIVSTYFESFEIMLSLLRALSNVQRLSLKDSCFEALNAGVLQDQQLMFRNLNYVELGRNEFTNWDQALLGFLQSSPFLATLVFLEGLTCPGLPQAWRTAQIPLCFRSHLKRIVIKLYRGSEQDLDLIAFMLRNASVLEVVECILPAPSPKVYQMSLESTLKNLPRASINCSIRVI